MDLKLLKLLNKLNRNNNRLNKPYKLINKLFKINNNGRNNATTDNGDGENYNNNNGRNNGDSYGNAIAYGDRYNSNSNHPWYTEAALGGLYNDTIHLYGVGIHCIQMSLPFDFTRETGQFY